MKDATAGLYMLFTIILAIAFSTMMAFPIKWTWNTVMPYVFNLKELTWGQAWCLTFLCNVLLKPSSSSSSSDSK